jgi:hypothetical protein
LQQKASERREYTTAMFMAHGRNFVAAKTSERRDYVLIMFMAHERRNIAQSQFTFRSLSECGGRKGGGGVLGMGWSKRKFNRFEFQHRMVVCVGPE